jgi:hypothetical protein
MYLSGDRALKYSTQDRLGFAATAEAIAASILRQPNDDGLVIGIEGRWGSGKSSLVNLTVNALRHAALDAAPEVVEFKPWLIGDRDSLLLALFTELAIAVDAIEETAGDDIGRRKHSLGETSKKVVGFATHLGGVGTLAKVAGAFLPGAALAGDAMEAIAKAAKEWDGQHSIAKEKNELRERLGSLPRRIVITIDDVDRLEPNEVMEILRLVRSVADFPNVIYVLCYDASIVAHSIQVAARVENGYSYIEKIVQVEIPTPLPESFDLRHWFRQEISYLSHNSDEAGDWRFRLNAVIDMEGGRYLLTPRHVVRCLDSIRFFWDALCYQIDLSDFVWLNIIKIGNPKLYDWIEHYLAEAAAQASGNAVITDDEKRSSRKRLDEALEIEGTDFDDSRYRLSEFLPGIAVEGHDRHGLRLNVLAEVQTADIVNSVKWKRLASPDHYRIYFAIQQPRNAPKKEDYDVFFRAVDSSVEETSEILSRWSDVKLSTGATKIEVMLSRFVDDDSQIFDSKRAETFIYALVDKIDALSDIQEERFSDPHIWMEGNRIFKWLLPKLEDCRKEILQRMFQGRSLDWLTSILRSETFAHSRMSGGSSGDQILSADELNIISILMINRYKNLDLNEWKHLRRPLSALYAWSQAGLSPEPRDFLSDKISTDDGLLTVLELLSGRVRSSSRGEYITLQRRTVSEFLDFDNVLLRTINLSRDGSDPFLKHRAIALVKRFEDGKDF